MVLSTAPTPPHRVNSFYRNRLLRSLNDPNEDRSNRFYQGSTVTCPAQHSCTVSALKAQIKVKQQLQQLRGALLHFRSCVIMEDNHIILQAQNNLNVRQVTSIC